MNISNVNPFRVSTDVRDPAVARLESVRDASVSQAKDASLRVTAGIGSVDAVEDISESELRRDDPLGCFVSRAFDLPAPPAPLFAEGGA